MPACAAYGCSNKPDKKLPGITFHRFPSNLTRRIEWIKAVKRKNWKPSSSSVLCSEHFSEEKMDRTSLSCVRLRENAVPDTFKAFPSHLQVSNKSIKKKTIQTSGKSELNNDLVVKEKNSSVVLPSDTGVEGIHYAELDITNSSGLRRKRRKYDHSGETSEQQVLSTEEVKEQFLNDVKDTLNELLKSHDELLISHDELLKVHSDLQKLREMKYTCLYVIPR